MQFPQGTGVWTMDGKQVGHVDRVVLNPKTKQVTHIVIHKGLLLPQDQVMPMDLIAKAGEDQVKLRVTSGGLEQLPEFQEIHYILVNEDELERGAPQTLIAPPSLYAYPPYTDAPMMGYFGAAVRCPSRRTYPQRHGRIAGGSQSCYPR